MRRVALTRGQEALVDDADYDVVAPYNWYAQRVGPLWYAARTIYIPNQNPRCAILHRLLLGVAKGVRVKFVDGNGLNCQRVNLVLDQRDLVGSQYGLLRVIASSPRRNGSLYWTCACECGSQTEVAQVNWGKIASCGCLLSAVLVERNFKHGLAHSRTHSIWVSMRQRCQNPDNQSYDDYGGRGITVCERWADFALFYEDMGPAPEGFTLERQDNNGPYSPDNCRWATRKEQNRNTRRTHLLSFNNKTQCISAWAEDLKIPSGTISRRIKMGMPIERVLHQGKLNV